jgi:hypothetical protein
MAEPDIQRLVGSSTYITISIPPLEKGFIERTMQHIKDRMEYFDDYFPCRAKSCKINHVKRWLRFFVDYQNSEIYATKGTEPIVSITILYGIAISTPV